MAWFSIAKAGRWEGLGTASDIQKLVIDINIAFYFTCSYIQKVKSGWFSRSDGTVG